MSKYEKFKTMTEKELRECEKPWPKTKQDLDEFIKVMTERKHDYGTCVYAVSLIAVAAFNFTASKLGITGFQASCADLDILKRTRNMKCFQILNIENILYPQYCNDEHFPSLETLLDQNREFLASEANKLLNEKEAKGVSPNPRVEAHWKKLVAAK